MNLWELEGKQGGRSSFSVVVWGIHVKAGCDGGNSHGVVSKGWLTTKVLPWGQRSARLAPEGAGGNYRDLALIMYTLNHPAAPLITPPEGASEGDRGGAATREGVG